MTSPEFLLAQRRTAAAHLRLAVLVAVTDLGLDPAPFRRPPLTRCPHCGTTGTPTGHTPTQCAEDRAERAYSQADE